MSVKLNYYAAVADAVGRDEEERDCAGRSAADLYAELRRDYAIPFSADEIRVAINHEYSDFSTIIRDDDLVVFISPVSGG